MRISTTVIPTCVRVAVMLATVAPTATPAQGRGTAGSETPLATIVLVPDLGATDRRAVILRRREEEPENVVLVNERTTPRDLARAMGALVRSLETQGVHVTRDIRAYVTEDAGASKPYVNEGHARADLIRLAGAPVYDLEGIGPGRAITVRLSPRTVSTR